MINYVIACPQQVCSICPVEKFINKYKRTLRNDILAHGKRDYRPHLAVNYFQFLFLSLTEMPT